MCTDFGAIQTLSQAPVPVGSGHQMQPSDGKQSTARQAATWVPWPSDTEARGRERGCSAPPETSWREFSFKLGTLKLRRPSAVWWQAKCPDAGGKEVTLLLIRELFKSIWLLLIYSFKLDVNTWRKLFPFHEVFYYLMEGCSKQDRNISFFCFKSKLLAWLGFQNPKWNHFHLKYTQKKSLLHLDVFHWKKENASS